MVSLRLSLFSNQKKATPLGIMWNHNGRSLLGLLLLCGLMFQWTDADRLPLTNSQQCSRTCKNQNKIYTYKKGEVYVYDVQSTHQQTHGTGETVALTVNSLAHIQVISECEFALKVEVRSAEELQQDSASSASVKQNRAQVLKTELEGEPLRFSWDDGRITAICPARKDSLNSVNFKRGLLSLFQLGMDDLESPIYQLERDVSGECYTEYRTESTTATNVVVRKSKNVAGCAQRFSYISATSGVTIAAAQEQSQAPFINGEHTCTMTVNTNGPLQSVSCNESHWLQPPFVEKGPVISVIQKVRLTGSNPSTKIATVPEYESNLVFEHPTELPMLFEDLRQADKTLLLKMVADCALNSRTETSAQYFLKVVHTMRAVSTEQLKAAGNEIKTPKYTPAAQRVFYDALIMTQTDASVDLLVNYILQDTPHAKTLVKSFLVSSAFVTKPSEAMIGSVKKLLAKPEHLSIALLTISTLHRKLCQKNPECLNFPEVESFVVHTNFNLKESCKKQDAEKAVMYLKALRNMGPSQNSDKTLESLKVCKTSAGSIPSVKVAIYEVLQFFPCVGDAKDMAMVAFVNRTEDTQVRIAAYQSVIHCADASSLENVVTLLKTEDNLQVASFVWSHLNSMLVTQNPFHSTLSNLVQKHSSALSDLRKDLNLDPRTYSKFYETSMPFSDEMTATTESSIVYGPNSFVPQHTRVNVTLNMFGRSVNVLDVGLTTQGLDESFLKIRDYILRSKFGSKLDKKLKSVGITNDVKFNSKVPPSITVSIKMFGHEIAFCQNFLNQINSRMLLLNQLSDFFSGKRLEWTLQRNSFIAESVLTFPTMAGFPVHMQMASAASLDLSVSAQLQTPPNMKVETNLMPKFSMYSIGRFFVNTPTTKIGAFAEYSGHTNISLGAGAEFKNGDLQTEGLRWRVFVSPVNKKQSIISLKREVTQYRANRVPQGKVSSPVKVPFQKSVCTGESIYSVLGTKVCVTYLPNTIKNQGYSMAYEWNVEKFAGYVFHFEYQANADKTKLLPKKFIVKSGLENLAPRFVLLNITDLSSGSIAGYALEVKLPLLGQYAAKLTSESNNVYKGTLTSGGKVMASVTGFVGPEKILWTAKDGSNKDMASFEVLKSSNGRTVKVDVKKGVPFNVVYTYAGSMTSAQAFARGRHTVVATLPNQNKVEFSASTTDVSKAKINVNEATLSVTWKSKDDVLLDYTGKYSIEIGQSYSVNVPEVTGKLLKLEFKHNLKGKMNQWIKNWGITSSASIYVSESIYNPVGYSEPRLVEVYLNWLYPTAPAQDVKYAFLMRMDPPEMLKGNYTFQSIAKFPNTTTIQRKAQLAWRLNGISDTELVFQLTNERPGLVLNVRAFHQSQLPQSMSTELQLTAKKRTYALSQVWRYSDNRHTATLQLHERVYEIITEVKSTPTSIFLNQKVMKDKSLLGVAHTNVEFLIPQGKYTYDMTYNSTDKKVQIALRNDLNIKMTADERKVEGNIDFLYRSERTYRRVKLVQVQNHDFSGITTSTSDTLNITIQTAPDAAPYKYSRIVRTFTDQNLFYFGTEYSAPNQPEKDLFVLSVSNGLDEMKMHLQQQHLGEILLKVTSLPAQRQPTLSSCPSAHVVDQQVDVKLNIKVFSTPVKYELKKVIQRESGCSSNIFSASGSVMHGSGGWRKFEYSWKKIYEPDSGKVILRGILKHDLLMERYKLSEIQLETTLTGASPNKPSPKQTFTTRLDVNSPDAASKHKYQLSVTYNSASNNALNVALDVNSPWVLVVGNSSVSFKSGTLDATSKVQWSKSDNSGKNGFITAQVQRVSKPYKLSLEMTSSFQAVQHALAQVRTQYEGGSTDRSFMANISVASQGNNHAANAKYSAGTGQLQWDSSFFKLSKGLFQYTFTKGTPQQDRRLSVTSKIQYSDGRVAHQFLLTSTRREDWSRWVLDSSLENRFKKDVFAQFSISSLPNAPSVVRMNVTVPGKLQLVLRNATWQYVKAGNGLNKFLYGLHSEASYGSGQRYTYSATGQIRATLATLSYVSFNSLYNGKPCTDILLDTLNRTFQLRRSVATDSRVELLISVPTVDTTGLSFDVTLELAQYLRRSSLRFDAFEGLFGLNKGKTTTRGADAGQSNSFYLNLDLRTAYDNAKRFHSYFAVSNAVGTKRTLKFFHDVDMKLVWATPLKGVYTADVSWDGSTLQADLQSNGQKTHALSVKKTDKKVEVRLLDLKSNKEILTFSSKWDQGSLQKVKWDVKLKDLLESKADFGDDNSHTLMINVLKAGKFDAKVKPSSRGIGSITANLKSHTSDFAATYNAVIAPYKSTALPYEKIETTVNVVNSAWNCRPCVFKHTATLDEGSYESIVQVLQNNLEKFRLQEGSNWKKIADYGFRYTLSVKSLSLVDASVHLENFLDKSTILKVDLRNLNALLHVSYQHNNSLFALNFKAANMKFDMESNLLRIVDLVVLLVRRQAQKVFQIGDVYYLRVNSASLKLQRLPSALHPNGLFSGEILHPDMGKITIQYARVTTAEKTEVSWNLTTPWTQVKRLNSAVLAQVPGVGINSVSVKVNLDRGDGSNYVNELAVKYDTTTKTLSTDGAHKGTYDITFKGVLKLAEIEWQHDWKVKDVAFSRLIARSESLCQPASLWKKGNGICRLEVENSNRVRVLHFERSSTKAILEMAWNKENHGLIRYERVGMQVFRLKTPVRNVEFESKSTGFAKHTLLLKTDHPTQSAKTANFQWDFDWSKISEDSSEVTVKFTSNMFNKPLLVTLTKATDTSVNIRFVGDAAPFFSITIKSIDVADEDMAVNVEVKLKENTWKYTITLRYGDPAYRIGIEKVGPTTTESYEVLYEPLQQLRLKADKYFLLEVSTVQQDFVSRFQASLRLNPSDKSVDFSLEHGTNPLKWSAHLNTSSMDIGLNIRTVSQRAIRGDLVRTKKTGERTKDASLSILFDKDNFLRTEVNWRKGIWADYQNLALNALEPASMKRIFDYYINLIREKRSAFFSQFGQPFVKAMDLNRVIDYVKSVANDLEEMGAILQKVYDEDAFYMKTIFKNAGQSKLFKALTNLPQTLQFGVDAGGELLSALSRGLDSLYQKVYQFAQRIAQRFDSKAAERFISRTVTLIKDVREAISKVLRKVASFLEQIRQTSRESRESLRNYLADKLATVLPKDLQQYGLSLIKKIAQFVMTVKNNKLSDWYKKELQSLDALRKDLANFKAELAKVREAMSPNRTTTSSKTLSTRRLLSLIVQGKYTEAYDALFRPNDTRIEVNLEKGQILVVAFVSPVFSDKMGRAKAIYKLIPQQLYRGRQARRKALERFYYYMDYLMERYGSYQDLTNILPPFTRSAWIYEKFHFSTFDGAAGYMHPNCEVILARDSSGSSRFTVTYLPKTNAAAVMTITIGSSTYKLSDNGIFSSPRTQQGELQPYVDSLVYVTREGQKVAMLTAPGLVVELHVSSGLWHMETAGALHSQVEGLLGTNNYHRHDDLLLANGKLPNNNEERLKSWTKGSCTVSGPATRPWNKDMLSGDQSSSDSVVANPNLESACNEYFQSYSSHLSRCFFAVDPRPYHHLCRFPSREVRDQDAHVCDVEKAFVASCIANSVSVRVRKNCVKCRDGSTEGVTVSSNGRVSKERFLFLVEDANCLSQKKDFLLKLAEGLGSGNPALYQLGQLTSSGYHSISMPHGALDGTLEQFKAAVNRLATTKADAPSGTNTLQAVYDFADMPTPAEYRDHIILFGCSKCSYGSKNQFAKVASLLKRGGIQLHYFTSSFGTLNVEHVVGMDSDNVYRLLPGEQKPDKKTRDRSIRLPNDACGPLAMDSAGSLWSTEDPTVLLKVLTDVNRRIKWTTGHEKYRQTCVCRSDKFGNSELECRHPISA